MKAAMETLDSMVVKRSLSTPYHPQHLCLDKGYDFPEIERGVVKRRYVPHIRHRGENLDDVVKCHQPKRWVVERSASWINRFRKLLVRFEKKAENYLALVQLCAALLCTAGQFWDRQLDGKWGGNMISQITAHLEPGKAQIEPYGEGDEGGHGET